MIHDLIISFVKSKTAAGREASTITYYEDTLGQFALFVPAWPPTYDDIVEFFLFKQQTCNNTTLDSYARGINSFLNWCQKHGFLTTNPMEKMDKINRPKKLPRSVTTDVIKALFATLDHQAGLDIPLAVRDRAIFRLAYDTGIRATELARSRISYLNLKQGSLLVEGKGSKERSVYFGQKCGQAIKMWLNTHHPGEDWLFPSRLRIKIVPMTRKGIGYALKKWSKLAGVTLTAHQIRHTYAIHALNQGVSVIHVQHQLGHSDLSTTAIYLRVDDAARRKAHQGKLGDQL